MRSPFFVFCLLSLCPFILHAEGTLDLPGAAKAIERFDSLGAEERKSLASLLGGRRFGEDTLEALGSASVTYAEKVLGRDKAGKLKPVKDELAMRILKLAGEYLNQLPPEKTPAFAKAGELFGEIEEGSPRTRAAAVLIDPRQVRWHSTGLYVPPGEVVTLRFPEAWLERELKVQISGHQDVIPLKRTLYRTPAKICRTFPVSSRDITVASAFGGALYIDTGVDSLEEAPFEVLVNGAVHAPYYVLGKTSLSEWVKEQRENPAPYAEFVSDRIALSFPSKWIRDLRDPERIMTFWTRVVALHDELGGLSEIRRMPERVNIDVQISVGLFHAGYPTQGPQDKCEQIVDWEFLTQTGAWGWFHEMGHESQRRPDKAWPWNNPYTFDDSIEVTVNLFSTHAFDRMGLRMRSGWTWTATPDGVREKAKEALKDGGTYLEADFGEKLSMYLLIRDAFGWEPIQQALSSYSYDQDRTPNVLPEEKDDEAKRREWLVRLSKATGRNLGPYLNELWGLPLTEEDLALVATLPVWMPEKVEQLK